MKECIVHFGMPKTGSTAIQTWLLRSLEDRRFHYVNIGRRGSGNLIAATFMDNPDSHHRNRKRGASAAQVQAEHAALRRTLEESLRSAAPDAVAVYSAELLANFSEAELRRLCGFLAPHVERIRAVGYVRRPVSFMQSVFQQRLKSGAAALDMPRNYPHYRDRFGKFETVLGAAQVEYWLFDPRAFPGGCVVQDFCRRTGIDFRGGPVARANESLTLPAVQLLFAYRRFGPGFGVGPAAMRENSDLKDCLKLLPGEKLRFHHSLVAPLLAAQAGDIAWMEARLQSSLDEAPVEDAGAVRGEQDLLRFSADSLAWLSAQIGDADPWRWHPGMSPEEVAGGVHRLRLALASRRTAAGTRLDILKTAATSLAERSRAVLARIRRRIG